MKTTILTFATMLATVFGISNSALASAVKHQKVSAVLPGASKINKIEVHGNVQLYVSDGTVDNVKIYGSNHKGGQLMFDNEGVLRISSYQAQKLVVWVTVTNLCSLAAYDNADVRSFGLLSAIELNIRVYDNASAELNLDVYQAYISLNGHAKADLAGNIDETELDDNSASFANTTNLISAHIVKTRNSERIASDGL